MNLETIILLGVSGCLITTIWFICRSMVIDGTIKTNNPTLFFLGKKYKTEEK